VDKNDAFLAAISENHNLIFKVASIYGNSIEDRNDLKQEIIYQLWKSYETFNQKSSLSTWIYRVALNVAIYHLKMVKRKILTLPLDEQFLNFHEVDNREIEERWEIFKQHIDNLSLLDKGIIILYLENKSHEEIAQIIGISISNVGAKLSRIKEKLRKQISNK